MKKGFTTHAENLCEVPLDPLRAAEHSPDGVLCRVPAAPGSIARGRRRGRRVREPEVPRGRRRERHLRQQDAGERQETGNLWGRRRHILRAGEHHYKLLGLVESVVQTEDEFL